MAVAGKQIQPDTSAPPNRVAAGSWRSLKVVGRREHINVICNCLNKLIESWTMMVKKDISQDSFPSNLSYEVTDINNKILFQSLLSHSDSFELRLNNEILRIPYRIYLPEPAQHLVETLNNDQLDILNCFYTRHHNGYIRERCLREIINSDNPFVVPFVFQLVGEYVYEIIEMIHDNLNHLNLNNYLSFIYENKEYYYKTRDRMISYWNSNRRDHGNLKQYKGLQIFKYFERHFK